MARNTYYEILKNLAPESTGNQPIEVSMPLLYYHLGKYHVISLVTGGQHDVKFAHKNRDAGRILGIAFYHPEDNTGEYLTLARAKEKYGLDLSKLANRDSARLSQNDGDDKVILPNKLKQDIAERFIKRRASLEEYNSHVMLAAAQHVDEGKRYLCFKLNPDDVPRLPDPQRHRLLMYRVVVFFLALALAIIGFSFSNYYSITHTLQRENAALRAEMSDYRYKSAVQTTRKYIEEGEYKKNSIIAADTHNGMTEEHTRGNKEARVTVITYVDFQCPGCASVWPILQQVYQEYSDRVLFVQRNYPLSFHENAVIAARSAEAAAIGGYYWEMSDALFTYQNSWSGYSGDNLLRVLNDMYKRINPNADITTFDNAMESDSVYDKIAFDYNLGYLKHDVEYTPTIYVNGEKVDIENGGDNIYELIVAKIKAHLSE